MSGYNLESSQQKRNLRLLTQELKYTKTNDSETNDNTKDKEHFVVNKNVADEEVPTMQPEMDSVMGNIKNS